MLMLLASTVAAPWGTSFLFTVKCDRPHARSRSGRSVDHRRRVAARFWRSILSEMLAPPRCAAGFTTVRASYAWKVSLPNLMSASDSRGRARAAETFVRGPAEGHGTFDASVQAAMSPTRGAAEPQRE